MSLIKEKIDSPAMLCQIINSPPKEISAKGTRASKCYICIPIQSNGSKFYIVLSLCIISKQDVSTSIKLKIFSKNKGVPPSLCTFVTVKLDCQFDRFALPPKILVKHASGLVMWITETGP